MSNDCDASSDIGPSSTIEVLARGINAPLEVNWTVTPRRAEEDVHTAQTRRKERRHRTATTVKAKSTIVLKSWDSLLRHDAFDHAMRKKHRLDGNPFVPASVYALGGIPERYLGRFTSSHPLPPASGNWACGDMQRCAACGPNGVNASHVRSKERPAQPTVDDAENHRQQKSAPLLRSFRPRSINQELLSERTKEQRLLLRARLKEDRSRPTRVSDRIVGLTKLAAIGSAHTSVVETPQASSRRYQQPRTPLGDHREQEQQRQEVNNLIPTVEVYFEGEARPLIVLRDCVHPLDSIASLRRQIDDELRQLPGGATIATESNWTFAAFHPQVIKWLQQLQVDFMTFYSDSEHSRYEGTQAKEMKLTVLRHREQAEILRKFLCVIRLSIETVTPVANLFPRATMSKKVFEHIADASSTNFFSPLKGPVPQLPPFTRCVHSRILRDLLHPVKGAIMAQLGRMEVFASRGVKVPPPTDCNLPTFFPSAERVALRLSASHRRTQSKRDYAMGIECGTLIRQNQKSESTVEVMIPRITLIKNRPSNRWTSAEVMLALVSELCTTHRGADADEELELARDTVATEDELIDILLASAGGDHKRPLSPSKRQGGRRSPTAGSPSKMSSRGNSPTHAQESEHVALAPAEELRRVLEEKVAPLHIQDELGWSLLDYACWHRRPAIVRTLCGEGNISLCARDHLNGDTVLHRYIKSRHRTVRDMQCLRAILEHSRPEDLLKLLQTRNLDGHTPLLLALHERDFTMTQTLMHAAENPRCGSLVKDVFPSVDEQQQMQRVFSWDMFVDECSVPHLEWVAQHTRGRNGVVMNCSDATTDEFQATVLHRVLMAPTTCCTDSQRDEAVLWALQTENPLSKDCYGRNAYHCAARTGAARWLTAFVEFAESARNQQLTATNSSRYLVRQPTPSTSSTITAATSHGKIVAQAVDNEDNTVLHTLLQYCRSHALVSSFGVSFLVHPSILPHVLLDQVNHQQNTILHLVMQRRNLEVATQLCKNLKYESGATLQRLFTLRNDDGDTILGCAIRSQFSEGVKALLCHDAVAEVALTAPNSDDRLPLLLAVDVIAARDAAGNHVVPLTQRPHCEVRESSDVLHLLLQFAEHNQLEDSIIRAHSGRRNETALHAAVRHVLWHQSSLLVSRGASPNKPDGAGVSSLEYSFLHPRDVSIARLLAANDTSDWNTGNTLLQCILARGAASRNLRFLEEMFLQRYPFPWKDENFSTTFLMAAARTGNLLLMEKLLFLGAWCSNRSSSIDSDPCMRICETLVKAQRSTVSKSSCFIVSSDETADTEMQREAVERIVLRIVGTCKERDEDVHPELLLYCVHLGLIRVVDMLWKELGLAVADSTRCSWFSRSRGPFSHLLVEIVRRSDYMTWPVETRREVVLSATRQLLSPECMATVGSVAIKQWYKSALSYCWTHCNVEALLLILFCGERNDHVDLDVLHFIERPQFQMPLLKTTTSDYRQVVIACSWIVRRWWMPPPLMIASLLLHYDDVARDVLSLVVDVVPIRIIAKFLTESLPLHNFSKHDDRRSISVLGRRWTTLWLRWGVVPSCLSVAAQHLDLNPGFLLMWEQLVRFTTTFGSTHPEAVSHILRDSLFAAVRQGATATARYLIQTVEDNMSRIDQLSLSDICGTHPTLSITAFECYLTSTHFCMESMILMVKTTMAHCNYTSSKTLTDILHSISIRVRDTFASASSSDKTLMMYAFDVMLTFLLGGFDSIQEAVRKLRPRQSMTAIDHMFSSVVEYLEIPHLIDALEEACRSDEACTFLCETIQPHVTLSHVECILDIGLTLSLHTILQRVLSFHQLRSVFSHCELSTGAKFLTAMMQKPSSIVPDALVNMCIDMCREEVAEWQQHTSWWVDHLLDVYHPTNMRKIPAATRQRTPILSMMRDVARSDPATASSAKLPSKPTPLHCGVQFDREESVSHILSAQSRELNVNAVDALGRSPLMIAAQLARTSIASQLVSTGVDIMLEDRRGLPALCHATTVDVLELLLADDDGAEAANSRSSASHKTSPLLYQLKCGRASCAMALLQSPICENCVIENMIDADSGETLLHHAARHGTSCLDVLRVLLDRLPASYLSLCSTMGYSPRDYCTPRSPVDELFASKSIVRKIRLWPEGKYSIGCREYRALRHQIPQVLGIDRNCESGWKTLLKYHEREREVATVSGEGVGVDELAWEFASQGQDAKLLALLELGAQDMQCVRLYGIPAPRSENDKRSLARDINQLLQMKFGGCRGGCQLVFPDAMAAVAGATERLDADEFGSFSSMLSSPLAASTPTPSASLASAQRALLQQQQHGDKALIEDATAAYAAARMMDEDRIPSLMTAQNLTVKNRTLVVLREPPKGPQYRTQVLPRRTSLLHLICKNACLKSLYFVIQNNSGGGSPSRLICELFTASYDENGMTPIHVAILHRQWTVMVELLRARVPFGTSQQFNTTPMQIFASAMKRYSLEWISGSPLPDHPQAFISALLEEDRRQGGGQLSSIPSLTQRFLRLSEGDAKITAFAMIRLSTSTSPAITARLQRVILTAILEPGVEKDIAMLKRNITRRWMTMSKSASSCTPLKSSLRRMVVDHITHQLDIVLDTEGADARDSTGERERMKSLFMYHLHGGVLQRLLQRIIVDSMLDNERGGAFGWVACTKLLQIRIQCAKKINDEPTVHVEMPSKQHWRLVMTVAVTSAGELRAADPLPCIEALFCYGILSAATELRALLSTKIPRFPDLKLNVCVPSNVLLLANQFAEAVSAERLLQSTLDEGSEVSAADVIWVRLREMVLNPPVASPAVQGGADATDDDLPKNLTPPPGNLSTTSSARNDPLDANALDLFALVQQVIQSLTQGIEKDLLPRFLCTHGTNVTSEIHLSISRCYQIQTDAQVTLLFTVPELCDVNFDEEEELGARADARVSDFNGLDLLVRNWVGSGTCQRKHNSLKSGESTIIGRGLQALMDARRAAKSEKQCVIVCPTMTRSTLITATSVTPPPPLSLEIGGTAAVSIDEMVLYRASEWSASVLWKLRHFSWLSSSTHREQHQSRDDDTSVVPQNENDTPHHARPDSVLCLAHVKLVEASLSGATGCGRWQPATTLEGLHEQLLATAETLQRTFLDTVVSRCKALRVDSDRRSSFRWAGLTQPARSSCLADVVGLVFPFIADVKVLWTCLRPVSRATHNAVLAVLRSDGIHSMAKGIAVDIESVRVQLHLARASQKRNIAVGQRTSVLSALGAEYLCRDAHQKKAAVATRMFQFFVQEPVVAFHFVASVHGVDRAAALPQTMTPPCRRMPRSRRLEQQPPASSRSDPLVLIWRAFRIIRAACDATWRMHNLSSIVMQASNDDHGAADSHTNK